MPELPEVENVRRKLKETVINKEIEYIKILAERIIRTPDINTFKEKLKDKTIIDIDRKGKHLIFKFENDFIVSHLRMEGKYEFVSDEKPLNKHDHVIFYFKDGTQLRYNDVRKFGTMDLVIDPLEISSVSSLGLEPMDKNLTSEYLYEKLQKKKTFIKNTLLDQSIIAGLGNIYVDEVLYSSSIHPERIANSITIDECSKLCKHTSEIISKAISLGGSSIRTYDSMGEKGTMQNLHKVYNRNNTPCQRCETIIKKTKLGGRGTHFCPNCQKL